MPLVYQQNINATTKIAVWHITEPEDFFLVQVPLQREIRHWHKRLQHLAGRLLLKELYPDFPVALIQIADTKKPFLENEPYHFSISHCGDYAAVIVSKTYRVGVDVELINEVFYKMGCSRLKNEALDIEIMYRKLNDITDKQFSIDDLCKIFKVTRSDRYASSEDAYTIALLFLKLKSRLNITI